MTERPRISVLIAAYNAAGFIDRSIRSVRSSLPTEIIVVDDCSIDQTWSRLETLKRGDPRLIPVRRSENGGPSAARNQGLAIARGDWIAVLDADDEYLPGRLDSLVRLGEELCADFVFDGLVVREDSRSCFGRREAFGRRLRDVTLEWLLSRDFAYQRLPVGYCKPVIRRSCLEAHALRYREEFRSGEDFLFLCEMVLAGARGYSVPEAFYIYRRDFGERRRDPRITVKSQVAQMAVLVQKYGSRLSDAAIALLRQRQRWILAQTTWRELRAHIGRGNLIRAISLVLRSPLVIPLALTYLLWYLNCAVDVGLGHKVRQDE